MALDAKFFQDMAMVLAEKDSDEALEKFRSVLDYITSLSSVLFVEAVSNVASMICQGTVTVITARQIGTELIHYIDSFPDDQLVISAFVQVLSRLQSRVIALEVQLANLRDLLAQRLVKVGDLREAVTVLRGIPIDSHTCVYSDEYKLEICSRIVDGFFKLKEPDNVESAINSVSKLLNSCKDERLKMRFKIAQAQLMDSKRKFLEAGQRYIELSIRFREISTDAERTAFLEHALLSAILGGAGQQRARLLAFLYKDERCHALQAFPILERMHKQRLISRENMRSLRPLLIQYYPHIFGDGGQQLEEVLERVVVEHNMLAASYLYSNITLENLGELLEVETSQAESIAAQMIEENRMVAQIDQIDGVVYFDKDSGATSANTRMQNLWASLNRILEGIETDHPQWVAARLGSAA